MNFYLDGKEYVITGKPGDWSFTIRTYVDSYQNDVHYNYDKIEDEREFFEKLVKAAKKQGALDKQREIVEVLDLKKMFKNY